VSFKIAANSLFLSTDSIVVLGSYPLTELSFEMASSKCAWCNSTPASGFNKVKFKVCSDCKAASYCSKECQKEDWRYHQLVCKQFLAFTSSTPCPSSHHKLALLLPANRRKPQFIWVRCEQHREGTNSWQYPHCKPHLGDKYTGEERVQVSRQLCAANPDDKRFALDHTIDLFVRDQFSCDGSKNNPCVWNIIKRAPEFDWKGPMIVLCSPGTSGGPPVFQDFKPADLRVVAEFFKFYGKDLKEKPGAITKASLAAMYKHKLFPTLANVQKPRSMVKGVNINSDLGQEFLSEIQFTRTEIDDDHAIFSDTQPTSISTHMCLPLLVRKYDLVKLYPDASPADAATSFQKLHFRENRAALFLMLDANTRSKGWGFADKELWDRDTGPVLVVRQDRKNITTKQVEVLAHFCRCELSPAMRKGFYERHDASEEETWKANEEFAKSNMCRKRFEEFFEKFRVLKIDGGDMTWKSVVSPYEV
jgi:hypothetical protein